MALVRILIDGYSLLHRWPDLAPGRPRHSSAAREALLARLRQYRDATHIPITVFFDGQGAPAGTPGPDSTPDLEILFSRQGRTADDLIERTAVRLRPYGEVLVVTDDFAERAPCRRLAVWCPAAACSSNRWNPPFRSPPENCFATTGGNATASGEAAERIKLQSGRGTLPASATPPLRPRWRAGPGKTTLHQTDWNSPVPDCRRQPC